MLRTRTGAALTLAALLVISVGCRRETPPHPNGTASATPQRGGTLAIGTTIDIAGVNDIVSGGDRFSADVISQMFLHLLDERPDYAKHPPTMAPELASSYDWSPDHKQLTFHLRPNVKWSDGVPVTAEDVVWTFKAQTSKEVAWNYADAKDQIENVVAVDPHTVRFDFKSVYSSQLLDANEGVILPKHAWSALPFSKWRNDSDWFRQHLVVDGPFILTSWQPQEQIVLERNPKYFEPDRPRVERVIFRVIPEKINQVTQLLTGSLDFVEAVPPASLAQLQKAKGIRTLRVLTRQYDYVIWNTARPFFANAALRRALTLAIDRKALIDSVWYGFGKIADSPILSNVWAHDPNLQPWPYDPAKAREILTREGWIDHNGDGIRDKNGVPFSFELLTNSDNRQRVDATVMIQSQLKKIGVDVRPRGIEFNTLVTRETHHQFDAALGGWGMDTSLDLRYAFHSDSIANGYNFGSYSNPRVDQLIEEAHAQSDLAAAKARLIEIQQILHHDQPMTFLLEPEQLDAVRDRVRDAHPNALSAFLDLQSWWIARKN